MRTQHSHLLTLGRLVPYLDGQSADAPTDARHVPVLENLTAAARGGKLAPAIDYGSSNSAETQGRMSAVGMAMARVLFRQSDPHVLLTGPRGIGKSMAATELARQAAGGRFAFLADTPFFRADVLQLDLRLGCELWLDQFAAELSDRPGAVLILDPLGAFLRAHERQGELAALFRAFLRQCPVRLIGVLSSDDHRDLIAGRPEWTGLFSEIALAEPCAAESLEIVNRRRLEWEAAYALPVAPQAAALAVRLSQDFILNAHLPRKAIDVLRRACDDAAFAQSELGQARVGVTEGHTVNVISEITGIPEETLTGDCSGVDFETLLAREILGQEAAVEAVAGELRLIRAGATDRTKPASVLFFAGMTGVGKTELAKQLARIYSRSKRLQTYSMGNFTESHSVSGIVGVPAGYVGHDAGGPLINDLLSDPYSVFLLDEAEKAHPNVWKPFLTLFDEGWIVDQRGVKAYADRAIFILTSNAGDDSIAQLWRDGKPMETITRHVKDLLARIRPERSSQPVFTPAFLSRITRIVVFRPLSAEAMRGICEKLVGEMQQRWRRQREKELIVPTSLVAAIADAAHARNTQSGGREGGRIVRKLLAELIEGTIQREASRHPETFQSATRLVLRPTDGEPAGSDPECALKVSVEFMR